MQITNKTKDTILAKNASLADVLFTRIKGLLGKNILGQEEALIIKPCSAIHTFFMRFAIDVLFVDRKNRIVALKENFKPYKISQVFFKASYVVELPSGTVSKTNTAVGDEIELTV
jgi:uncharacterized membrane protein (UPF0127 family)